VAFIVQLTDGTSSADFIAGTGYKLNPNGFDAPAPARRMSMSGGNLFRHGEDLIAQTYENRTVTLGHQIVGTSATALASNVQAVWALLRKAEDYAKTRAGAQVQLKYQWDGGAAPVYFNVLSGELNLGRDLHSPYLLKGTLVRNATLSLLCESFAVGTAETLTNYAKDPSFEVAGSALADWISDITATGAGTRTTAQHVYGTAALSLVMSSATAGMEWAMRRQSIVVSTGQTWSVGAYYQIVSLLNAQAVLAVSFEDATGGQYALYEDFETATGTGGTAVLMRLTNLIVPTGATRLHTRAYVLATTAGATGTVIVDAVLVINGGTFPTAWVSGRDVNNHFDDMGQAHINYLDLYNVPGDVPAPLQIKATENEAHTDFWVSHMPRINGTAQLATQGLWVEGEFFTGSLTPTANSAFSNGSYGGAPTGSWGSGTTLLGSANAPFGTATWPPSGTANDIPSGVYRVLARIHAGCLSGGPNFTGTTYMGFGYSYGGATALPTASSQHLSLPYTSVSPGVHKIVDLGVVTIPPIQLPQGGTAGTLTYNLRWYFERATSSGTNATELFIDYAFLARQDDGFGHVTKTGTVDVVMADSRSALEVYYLMTTADVVKSIPANQVGAPPLLHPESSRYYLLADGSSTGSIGYGWTVGAVYQPRFLHVQQ